MGKLQQNYNVFDSKIQLVLQEILSEKGYIYKGKYEGWYCTADEAFVAEDQTMLVKLPNGQEQRVSTESNRPVEWFSEENYLFELSKLREKLRHWLKSGKFSFFLSTIIVMAHIF